MGYGRWTTMPSGNSYVRVKLCLRQDEFLFPAHTETGLYRSFFSFIPDYNKVCDVIFDVLKIDHDDIFGFQQLSKEKYVLKFSKSFIFQAFCDKYDEKDVDIGNGKM